MGLTAIRTEVRRYTDKVFSFSNDNLDAAANVWYLTCWKELDKVAPHRTRTSQSLSLVKDQLTAYTLGTVPLAILEIQPPHANRNDRDFVPAVDDMAFRRNESQTSIQYAQEGEASITLRPAIDKDLTVTVHYIQKPSTITTSQAQLHFDDQTIAAGTIGHLLHSLNFPDALIWIDERNPKSPVGIAYKRLNDDLNIFRKFGNNSNLTMSFEGFDGEDWG